MIRAGQLRESVTIQTMTLQSADVHGGQAESWADTQNVRARIQTSGASERLAGRLAIAEASVLVTIRYTSNMNHKCRFKWYDGTSVRYLYPTSVEADEKRTTMSCPCVERLS